MIADSSHSYNFGLRHWKLGILPAAACAAWIAMQELDRLVGRSVGQNQDSYSIAALIDFNIVDGQQALQAWSRLDPSLMMTVGNALLWHTLLDIVFFSGYIFIFLKLARFDALAIKALLAVLAAEAAEMVLLIQASEQLSEGTGVGDGLSTMLQAATILKWAALGLFVLICIANDQIERLMRERIGRTWIALKVHRLQTVSLAILLSLSLAPLPGVFDQLPDVQRAWGDTPQTWVHMIWGLLIGALFVVGVYVLGRKRSERIWATYYKREDLKDGPTLARWWILPPLLVTAAAAFAQISGEPVDFVPFLVVVLLPLFLLACSALIRKRLGSKLWRQVPPQLDDKWFNRRRAVDVWLAGDVLAAWALTMGGLALVRSFTAPVFLEGFGNPRYVLFLLLGIIIVAVAFPVVVDFNAKTRKWAAPATLGIRGNVGRYLSPTHSAASSSGRSALLIVMGSAALLALFALFPSVSAKVGVYASTLACLGLWMVALGTVVVDMQRVQPLAVFRRLEMRANPVISVCLAFLITGSLFGTHKLHDVQWQTVYGPWETRPTIAQAFEGWISSSKVCDQTSTADSPPTRPMLVIAAQGGGIRAADWTVRVLDALGRSNCGQAVTLLSSGVSGGSVGLSLAQAYWQNFGDNRQESRSMVTLKSVGHFQTISAVEALAGPDALSAAVAGAFIGDTLSSATGVRLPSFVPQAPSHTAPANRAWRWRDRAALMEETWSSAVPLLRKRFEEHSSGPTGYLILNSTITGLGCRAHLSELVAGTGHLSSNNGKIPDCRSIHGVPLTVDLLSEYASCGSVLSSATAAMLSARFATITPAGRIPNVDAAACKSKTPLQAIDGGYSDNTGLGTIADIWPAISDLVRRHNDDVSAGHRSQNGNAYILPLVLYIQNEPGADITPPANERTTELLVPLAGQKAKDLQTESSTWAQRLQTVSKVCSPGDAACENSVDSILSALPGRSPFITANPNSLPAVDPPLGWTLSEMSRKRLGDALKEEIRLDRSDLSLSPSLANLLAVLAKGQTEGVER